MRVHLGQRIVRAIGLGLLLCIFLLGMHYTGQMQVTPASSEGQSGATATDQPQVKDFNPNYVIADPIFTDGSTMTASEIQAFLESHGPKGRSSRFANFRSGLMSGADAVAQAAQQHGINPKVLLTAIEVKTGLITSLGVHDALPDLISILSKDDCPSPCKLPLFAQIDRLAQSYRALYDHGHEDIYDWLSPGDKITVDNLEVAPVSIGTIVLYHDLRDVPTDGDVTSRLMEFVKTWQSVFEFGDLYGYEILDTRDDIGFPFAESEDWYVYQGYDSNGTHSASYQWCDENGQNCRTGVFRYAFDLVKDSCSNQNTTGQILAVATGAIYEPYSIDEGAWGKGVKITLADGTVTEYDHLENVPTFTSGQTVSRGTRLGDVFQGKPGGANHLHFQVNIDGSVRPLTYGLWHYPDNGPWGSDPCDNGEWSGTKIAPSVPDDAVYLYEHANFRGNSIRLDGYMPNFPAELNDQVSSVHVPDGWIVILFEHANYQGNYLELWNDDADLSRDPGQSTTWWNDTFSSAVASYLACPWIPGLQTSASPGVKISTASDAQTSNSTCLPPSGGAGSCSANAIDEFLRSYGSPLAGHGGTFVAAGRQWNVDPRLIVAIAGAESSLGKNGLCATQRHNPFGWGGGWPDCWNFGSWDDAINLVTRRIRELYLDTWHLYNIHDIGQTYCGSGCANWEPNVRWFYAELGGNPDTNDLSFAACSGTPQPSLQLASHLTLNPNPPLSAGTQATFDFDIRNTGGATAELDEVFVAANTATGDNWKAWASAVDIAPGETRHFQSQAPIWPHAGTWHAREIIVYFKDRHYEVFHPNCAFSANCDFEVQEQATPVPTNTPTPTPSPTPAPQGVRVYRDANYQGQSEYFKQNQHNLHSSGWGDVISSLKVDPDFYTTLFEHVDYLGRCQVFSSDQADLSGSWIGNDVVSSLELGTGPPPSDAGGIDGRITMIPGVVSDQLVAEGWARDVNSGPCPGIYQVRLYVDGNPAGDASYGHWNEDQGCHCGWRIDYDTRQLSQGSHTFEFQFIDRSGNVFSDPAHNRRTVVVDHDPPTNPTQVGETGCNAESNVWQTCRTPSFSWSGADGTGSEVAGYYVYFGGDVNGFSDHFVTVATYTPAAVDTGTYYLRVKTKDVAGNTARWKTLFVFKYDGLPPANPSFTVEKGGAPNDRWQNDVRAPVFAWSGAHDDHSGLDGFYIYFGPDPSGTANTLYRPGNSYTFDPIANAGEWAIYYLRVQARDRAGNLAPRVTLFTLRYDGAPPSGTVTINNDASQTDTVQVELTLSASDEGSGVADMQFRNNDGNWHDWTPYATRWYWQIPSVNRTAHTVSARFRDMAGNVSAAASDDIFLEVQPPRPSSSNFVLSASVNGIGGDQRSSGNFWMGDTIGEPMAPQPYTPAQQSSNFRIVSGFQASFQGESPEPTPTPTPSPTPPATPVPPPTPVPSYGLTINEGAQYTHRTDVTLRLIAPWDTEQVMVSNDGGFAGATWQPYVDTMEWTIDRYQDFVVDRTVYVRYPTHDGQEVQRQDNIILDPVEPVSSIRNTETLSQAAARLLGVHLTEGTVPIQVEWGADDGGGSGIRRYIVQVMDHADGVWRDWLNQTTEISGVFEAQPGHTYSFRTRAQDEAGNWEPPSEDTYTVSVAGLVLNGCVTLERRGLQGDGRWITQLYRESEAGIKVYKAGTTDLLGAFYATTDADGCFSVELAGLEPSTYDISVKGANTLSNKRFDISLPSGTEIDFGTLRVGDSNGDDRVNGADVSYMVPSFLKCEGDADLRPYADTNKDGCINGADVSALVPNFLQSGDDVSAMAVPPQGVQLGSGASTSTLRRAQDTAKLNISLSLSPSSPSVQAGDIFTLDIVADIGTSTADTVDAYIDFDPTLLKVVGESGAPATTIEPNTDLFDFVTFNVADNAAGQINFSATSFGSPLRDTFTVATIRFRARTKADVTDVILIRSRVLSLSKGGARISDLYQSGESLNVTITKWHVADSR